MGNPEYSATLGFYHKCLLHGFSVLYTFSFYLEIDESKDKAYRCLDLCRLTMNDFIFCYISSLQILMNAKRRKPVNALNVAARIPGEVMSAHVVEIFCTLGITTPA